MLRLQRFLMFSLSLVLMLAISKACQAQTPKNMKLDRDPAVLKKKYEKKTALPFMSKIEWQRQFTEAVKLAKEKRVPVVGYFTRSSTF